MAIRSNGVAVKVNSIAIGGLLDANITGRDVNFIDTTTQDSAAREFIGGLTDNGTIELTGKYDITDSGQLGLIADTGVTRACVITFSDDSTASASVVVGAFTLTDGLDDTVDFSISLKVSGALTIAASA